MKKLTIFNQKKEFRWNLTASNGRIIAESGEAYKRKSTMMKSIKSAFDGWVIRETSMWLFLKSGVIKEIKIIDKTL